MGRNTTTHFSKAPTVNVGRSAFAYNKDNKLTMRAGELVPFLCQEVLPGDTFSIDMAKTIRLAPSVVPVMDNLFLDTYFFYVPNRLVWDNFQQFMGENDKPWYQDVQHLPPSIKDDTSIQDVAGYLKINEPESLLDFLGVPVNSLSTGKKALTYSALRLNAYIKIWNDWFRSENLVEECPIWTNDGELPVSYYDAFKEFLRINFGRDVIPPTGSDVLHSYGSTLPVAKLADYFTRCLPSPQKGPDVLIPAGGSVELDTSKYANLTGSESQSLVEEIAPRFVNLFDGSQEVDTNNGYISITQRSGYTGSANVPYGWLNMQADDGEYIAYDPKGTLSLSGLEITVNNLRLAVQYQKLLEADARNGSRYIELLYSHFGVKSPDARLQRSEYLGGKRTFINMTEVVQTSMSTGSQPLGDLAGRSLTSDIENGFTKSFVEHGYIIGVCCVRPQRTYCQGMERDFFRFNRLDFYWPKLANIGEQPVKMQEIYLVDKSSDIKNDDVFGYQEAWAEYRSQKNELHGYMNLNGSDNIGQYWTYADYYSSEPMLSGEWLYQGSNVVERTLYMQGFDDGSTQFLCDFNVFGKVVRPMPVYSIPGLVDHH